MPLNVNTFLISGSKCFVPFKLLIEQLWIWIQHEKHLLFFTAVEFTTCDDRRTPNCHFWHLRPYLIVLARVFTLSTRSIWNMEPTNAKKQKMNMETDQSDFTIPETVQARFISDSNEEAGPPLELPTSVNVSQLGRICNAILQNVCIIFRTSFPSQKTYPKTFVFDFSGRPVDLFVFHKRQRSGTFARKIIRFQKFRSRSSHQHRISTTSKFRCEISDTMHQFNARSCRSCGKIVLFII